MPREVHVPDEILTVLSQSRSLNREWLLRDASAARRTRPETEQHDGRFVYHSDRARSARVGRGGPELSFDAFNGSIRLHREQ